MTDKNKQLTKYADVAMYKAEEIDPEAGPQVQLLSCNNDPLGTIAAAALMYEGKSVTNLAEITDDQRRYYLDQVQRSVLEAPLEFVNFHFIISGVTRGFTHQMVRQRTATYTQESTRFAVKETVPVGIPTSLDGTVEWRVWFDKCWAQLLPNEPLPYNQYFDKERMQMVRDYAELHASKEQLWRREWDNCVEEIDSTYNALVSAGMPAEDARGLLPTNLLTRINYNSSLRGLKEHAGVRLCTQAQQEWVTVWAKIKEAIREYGKTQVYFGGDDVDYMDEYRMPGSMQGCDASWQFNALADIFKPICYQTGKCQFKSDIDRHCVIRPRVDRHAKNGDPSSEWHDIDLQTEVYDNYAAARVSQ